MKSYAVYREGTRIGEVTADRVFSGSDGRLTFINNIEPGTRFGDTVAAFAPGSWTHFVSISTEAA